MLFDREWLPVGKVPIDTATCAITDRDAHKPLDVEETGYQIVGTGRHFCFSNAANADGSYPVFTAAQDEIVTGVYAQFSYVAGE